MSNPNCPHKVPYVVVSAPGGATITLAVDGITVVDPPLLYVLATIFVVTVATALTPPSNMKFLVPWTEIHDRRFVSLE